MSIRSRRLSYNKLGLRRRSELAAADYRMTDVRLMQLMQEPIRGALRPRSSRAPAPPHLRRPVRLGRRIPQHRFQPHVERRARLEGALRSCRRDRRGGGIGAPGSGHLEHAERTRAARLPGAVDLDLRQAQLHASVSQGQRAARSRACCRILAHEARYALRFEQVEPQVWSRATAYSMPRIGTDPDARRIGRDYTLIRAVFARIAVPLGDLD